MRVSRFRVHRVWFTHGHAVDSQKKLGRVLVQDPRRFTRRMHLNHVPVLEGFLAEVDFRCVLGLRALRLVEGLGFRV